MYILEQNRKLVGIHKAYWPEQHLNCATMITKHVIDVLQVWA